MATLILTTVGGTIGGPIGAALGGVLGNAIDRSVLAKPRGRQGPRLDELKVQTSSYGSAIPQIFGTMRVAGTIVWATDLKESKTTTGGGKGKPSTTNYSYSASFAVLLSARRVQGVGRIWADGKLLRGAAGDFKAQAGFRLHAGGEDQAADPLIAAAEGLSQTPALRGQAYAVFEDLHLADYGNRIPSLTFEVIADGAPVGVGDVAAAFGVTAEGSGRALGGFSAYGDSARGVLETLATVDGAWFAAGDATIAMRSGAGPSVTVADAGVASERGGIRRSRTIAGIDAAPIRLAVAHYDPGRDYQAGLQRASRPGAGGREERIELPAALDAGAAKAVAEGMLARANARRERRTVALPGMAAGVAGAADGFRIGPGDRVTIVDDGGTAEPGQWRVARWSLERMVVRLELQRITRAAASVPASPGRVSGAPDLVHGPTILHAFEIPSVDDVVLDAPRLSIAAAGGPGWRQAALLLSTDDGARWSSAGAATIPATLGTVVVGPGPGDSGLIDRASAIEVVLAHAGMTLNDADGAGLDGGANLALVGDELIQFGRAVPVTGTRWRLTELWRGRRGTEWAGGNHVAGERFILIEPEALVSIALPLATLGGTARVLASGVGDLTGPAEAATGIDGASIRPPAPVALAWRGREDGGAVLTWTRRSRAGWRWADGGDAPLAEEAERYRVTIGTREEIVTSSTAVVTAADRSDGAIDIAVRQLGTLAESRPVAIALPAS